MNVRGVVIVATLAFAVGCGGTNSKTSMSVSANALSAKTATATAPTTSAALTATAPTTNSSLDLGNGISLDRVRVVVRKLKLEGTLASANATPGMPCVREPDNEGHGDLEKEYDDEEIEPVLGPFLVDLSGTALSGGVQQAFDAVVPVGTFHELKFVIGPISAEKAGTDEKLAEMAAQNASIIVDGTVTTSTGTATFSFKSSLKAQIEREGTFVVSDAKGNNITLSFDPKSWFGGTGAARLDPTDPANQSAIEAKIRASIDVFEDDDRDGHDKEHEQEAQVPESDHVCTAPPPTAACSYTYSDWSACTNGSQTRTVVSATPVDCTGTPGPLSQSCGAAPSA